MAKSGSFLLSFSFILSFSLSEVSSLYWVVQKQNHKPISVTLAMRLDGPNLSPSGAIGSTPVSLKRPLSSRRRGSFLFGDNCYWAPAVHVTCSNPSPTLLSGDMTAFCAHYGRAMSSCVAMSVSNNQNVHWVPLNEASEWRVRNKHTGELEEILTISKPLYGAKKEADSATGDLLALYQNLQRKRKRHADSWSSSYSHTYISFPSITMKLHSLLHRGQELTVSVKLSLDGRSAAHHPIKSTPAISISFHLPLNICFHFPPGWDSLSSSSERLSAALYCLLTTDKG